MPIYTRTGDKGQTSLFNGQRVSKADLRVEAYGTVDELNSVIGVVLAGTQNSKLKTQNYNSKLKSELVLIQNDLFEIGSSLARVEDTSEVAEGLLGGGRSPRRSPRSSGATIRGIGYLSNRVEDFEKEIDKMTEQMPVLSNFILPGGGKIGAMLHFARTVARRAERKVVALDGREKVDKNIIMYLNRLSDLLFTMARFLNYKEKQKEIIWIKK